MAQQIDEMTQVARREADKIIDTALGELRAAARDIGRRHEIPENIGGLSTEELLGRMAYIPSMARDLRRIAGQEIAKQLIEQQIRRPPPSSPFPEPPPIEDSDRIDVSKIPDAIPVGMDVVDLDGVTVQTIKALKAAGLKTVGDVVAVPDEHLLKVSGIAEKGLQQIRAAIAKAATRKAKP